MYKYAIQTCAVGYGGGVVRLKRGQIWRGDDPLVKQRPELFADAPPIVHETEPARERPIEDMSAAPGKKRRTRTVR